VSIKNNVEIGALKGYQCQTATKTGLKTIEAEGLAAPRIEKVRIQTQDSKSK
jgi:hypothetical protein